MEDKNQLNDIVLDKKSSAGSSKKIILAAAVLMIILIIVIVVMNTVSSNNKNNLETGTKASQLPKPPVTDLKQDESQDQLFKPVTVIHENNTSKNANGTLDQIAKKLKAQSMTQEPTPAPTQAQAPAAVVKPVVQQAQKAVKHVTQTKERVVAKAVQKQTYTGTQKRYIQVGAFTRFKPNKKFLATIKEHGYSIGYKKVVIKGRTFTKVLIGPFASESLTREALSTVKKDINPQAFITSK